MWMKRTGATALALMCLLSGGSLDVAAQQQQDKEKQRVKEVVVNQDRIIVTAPPGGVAVGVGGGQGGGVASVGGDNTFVFVSSEMMIDGKVVKGAPYSAEAVTETSQTLSDGNRIVRKNTAQVYRDGEGRTRRDHTISVVGPFATGGEPPQTVFIHDPVAGTSYILDPRARTARKMSAVRTFERMIDNSAEGKAKLKAEVEAKAKAEGEGKSQPRRTRFPDYVFGAPAHAPMPGGIGPHPGGPAPEVWFYSQEGQEPKVEKLDSQTVEGVLAEGQKVTHTIPAGAIGNEQPINIVDERWYSPELQTVVMTRHSDPRFGETVYRLTNINRSEPARTLFEVPSDYTLKEGPPYMNTFRKRRSPEGAPKENNFQFYYNNEERQ